MKRLSMGYLFCLVVVPVFTACGGRPTPKVITHLSPPLIEASIATYGRLERETGPCKVTIW